MHFPTRPPEQPQWCAPTFLSDCGLSPASFLVASTPSGTEPPKNEKPKNENFVSDENFVLDDNFVLDENRTLFTTALPALPKPTAFALCSASRGEGCTSAAIPQEIFCQIEACQTALCTTLALRTYVPHTCPSDCICHYSFHSQLLPFPTSETSDQRMSIDPPAVDQSRLFSYVASFELLR